MVRYSWRFVFKPNGNSPWGFASERKARAWLKEHPFWGTQEFALFRFGPEPSDVKLIQTWPRKGA